MPKFWKVVYESDMGKKNINEGNHKSGKMWRNQAGEPLKIMIRSKASDHQHFSPGDPIIGKFGQFYENTIFSNISMLLFTTKQYSKNLSNNFFSRIQFYTEISKIYLIMHSSSTYKKDFPPK